MKSFIALLLSSVGVFAASGQWNGFDFAAWNGVAITNWDGSAIAAWNTLNVNLSAYWKLDETSGTRIDSAPSGSPQNLTDNNTVTFGAGKISNAASFAAASSESLSRADSTTLSINGDIDFTFAGWINMATVVPAGDARHVFSKSSGSADEYWLAVSSDGSGNNRFQWVVWTSDGGKSATATTFLSASTWYMFVVWHNKTADTLNVQYATGAVTFSAQTVFSGPTNGGVPVDSNSQFWIGGRPNNTLYFNGLVDEVGFWKNKILTDAEKDRLYNSFLARTCCPF